MKLGFAPAARQGLRDIGDHIASDSRARARTFVAEIKAHCVKAALSPQGYAVVVKEPLLLRRVVHGAYSIYFSILASEVRIERVIHGAADRSPGHFES